MHPDLPVLKGALSLITVQRAALQDVPAIHALLSAWQRERLDDLSGGFLSVAYRLGELTDICHAGDLLGVHCDGLVTGAMLLNNAVPQKQKPDVVAWLSERLQHARIGHGCQLVLAQGLKGQGHARAVSEAAFAYWKNKYRYLASTIDKANEPSRRLHERVGYRFFDEGLGYWIVVKDLNAAPC